MQLSLNESTEDIFISDVMDERNDASNIVDYLNANIDNNKENDEEYKQDLDMNTGFTVDYSPSRRSSQSFIYDNKELDANNVDHKTKDNIDDGGIEPEELTAAILELQDKHGLNLIADN